jgi:hypothetical protein
MLGYILDRNDATAKIYDNLPRARDNLPRARIHTRAETNKARGEWIKLKDFLRELIAHLVNKLKDFMKYVRSRSIELICSACEKVKLAYEILNRHPALLFIGNMLTLIGHLWTFWDTYEFLSGKEKEDTEELEEKVKEEVKAAMEREQEALKEKVKEEVQAALKEIREEMLTWRADTEKKMREMMTAPKESPPAGQK